MADDNLAWEDILVGLRVSPHLQIDSRTLLESNRDNLNETDCTVVGNPIISQTGSVGRLMAARIQLVKGKSYGEGLEYAQQSSYSRRDRPTIDYFQSQSESGPFADPSLLDPVDSAQDGEMKASNNRKTQQALEKDFSESKLSRPRDIVTNQRDAFRVSFSSGPSALLPP